MTRNVKRFLAGSLLSLIPSIALAGQVEHGFPDLLSERTEYVSLRAEGVQVPVREGSGGNSVAAANEDLLVFNNSGLSLTLGIQVLTGGLNGVYNPYPCPPALGSLCGYQVAAPAPTVAAPVVQQYYWTANAANPAAGKTCVWRVEVTDVAGSCAAQVFFGTYGGAVCTLDAVNSFIDPTTCYAQIVTNIQ
ncbi:hypothetical protein [Myxococcus qinghaiensis]|uniref:hypothetical protein n=1 Tax=Myxococcus qinghaiensis TaxID=2906758 RepID=UPI0020A7DEA4|nr:hypothetical protein [Myxococcus qinghaiensis]MCP3167745.1 hypothetical protein [Myxococcus qinghaiensis]